MAVGTGGNPPPPLNILPNKSTVKKNNRYISV